MVLRADSAVIRNCSSLSHMAFLRADRLGSVSIAIHSRPPTAAKLRQAPGQKLLPSIPDLGGPARRRDAAGLVQTHVGVDEVQGIFKFVLHQN